MKDDEKTAWMIATLEREAAKAWAWLRKISEYQTAFQEQELAFDKIRGIKSEKDKKDSFDNLVNAIKKKWGFLLKNPDSEQAPFGIQGACLNLLGRPIDGAVKLKNIDGVSLILHAEKDKLSEDQKREFSHYLANPLPKPNVLNVDIDFNLPDDEIKNDLMKAIKLFRKVHGIKPKRLLAASKGDLANRYKAFILENLGVKPRNIELEIYGEKAKNDYPNGIYRHRTKRLRDNVKKIKDKVSG